jgi:hypothetical protein
VKGRRDGKIRGYEYGDKKRENGLEEREGGKGRRNKEGKNRGERIGVEEGWR